MNTIVTRSSSRRAEENAKQLLPGIPDEISLDVIVPKLPWTAFQTLSSVSPKWRHAVQSGQVYQARVRSHATATLVVMNVIGHEGLVVYSTGDKSWLALPPAPNFRKTSYHCTYVFLDGKLYVFGKLRRCTKGINLVEVYVLDLACHQSQWKFWGIRRELLSRAASVYGRSEFKYCSTGGKLYVLRPAFAPGGYDPRSKTWSVTEDMSPVAGFTSEVYDPTLHCWSPRKPYPSVRRLYTVATLGEELLVYSGSCGGDGRGAADSMEVYNPAKDEWRVVGHLRQPRGLEALFTAQEKIYAMTNCSIWVHDSEKQSWRLVHRCSYPGMGPVEALCVFPNSVRAIDDELIARVSWYCDPHDLWECGLFRSRGFQSEKEEIVWEKAQLPAPFQCWILGDMMVPIQL